jgi:hypothetical protein
MRTQIYQSNTLTWAASKTFNVDMSFMNPGRDMVAPVVDELLFVLNISDIDTGTAGIRGGAFASAFSQILIKDQAGDRCNVRGSSLRIINQQEYGAGFQDPTAIAASQSNVARKLMLRVPFNPPKARRSRDFGLPLRGFLDGGKIAFTTSAALLPGMGADGGTISAATITVYAFVRDEGVREAKSRIVFEDESITLTNYDYNVSGALRYLIWYNGEINERGATAWSAQTISSKTIEMSQIDDFILQDRYQNFSKPARSSPGIVATADTYAQTDVCLTGQAVPIVVAEDDQKIPEMLQCQTFNVRTSLSSFTAADLPQVVKCYITERSAQVTARVLGVSDPGKAIGERGRVKAANGNARGVQAFPPNVTRMMPIKVGKRSANG